ncbi:hypothetical protein INN71_06425 [Nocardioides sp. ChNu-153]|uniref:hypothetical protein n=1 Tax=unclassified Nocardioides TaxID=2615069 RepID=UPI0024069870|nr:MULTISPECIES: hypothetical protein [unclassified Nocardioides]MDF9715199.1 hypothetical protein [Nocardioides sp. ChNu-99]MDN7121022.1 hypothetical protein [Nocardioides sp. ChNu-153]
MADGPRTATRLGLYAGALALVFAGAYGAGAALVPDPVVDRWVERAGAGDHGAEDGVEDGGDGAHEGGHR